MKILITIWNNVFYFNIFEYVFYFCDAKLNFQHHYSSIQCPCDPSEIILICWFAAHETFLKHIENSFWGFFDEHKI